MAFQPTPPVLPPTHGIAVRPPPRHFEFASPTDSSQRNRNGVSADTIRELVRQHGNNILIGFDLGRLNPDAVRNGNILDAIPPQQREAFRVARELGVRLHAYLGGPFGPTGSSFEQGEREFREESARRVGINTSRNGWENEWNEWGWKNATQEQLKVVKLLGFETFELDNLERDKRVKAPHNADTAMDTAELVKLYREVAGWDGPQRLMMKNLAVDNLRGVEQAMNNGTLNRARFADFHISEENNRSQWPEIERASARMGIQLARSHNTYAYATSQSYAANLQSEMLRLSNLQTQVATEQRWRINEPSAQPPQSTRTDQAAQHPPLQIHRIST